ncbi:hypothetical protein M9434_003662 [Picochlorum sp. BPE23]|nr:hypothetical protein M9434_003662 [Picochlorum sp. BPE23]
MILRKGTIGLRIGSEHGMVRQNSVLLSKKQSVRHNRRHSVRPIIIASGMHVPSDSFNGWSPERMASSLLETFLTVVAVKIVLAQLQGSGRGDLASYNAQGYQNLVDFIEEKPLTRDNASTWLKELMERDLMIAMRIIEVRLAYAKHDFEWHNLQSLCLDTGASINLGCCRDRFGPLNPDRSSNLSRERCKNFLHYYFDSIVKIRSSVLHMSRNR